MRVFASCLVAIVGAAAWSLGLGIPFGLGNWYLLRRYTTPEIEFGVRRLKLASLCRRGFAGLIDLAIISLTTASLAWQLTHNFDWLSWIECLNRGIDHPTVLVAKRIAGILVVWPVVLTLCTVITQAVWGITPDKWICGLRTVRPSFRPCEFARSLAREIVFIVDSCNLLCWTPGILSIALTDQRQRLGDLVADTIVVESRSMVS